MVSWLDVALPVALVTTWTGCFIHQLRSRTLLTVNDPEFGETIGRIIESVEGRPNAAD